MRALMHGTRNTFATMNAARTVLSRMDTSPAATRATASTATSAEPAAKRAPRRQRATEIPFDAKALVRGVVAKLQTHGNVEAERIRDAMRKAIAMLQGAVGN